MNFMVHYMSSNICCRKRTTMKLLLISRVQPTSMYTIYTCVCTRSRTHKFKKN
uniref:Uncharacterized protein n=1 Tax=Anguilla anguilla TaxID=7936 RepID=A0A0E9Q7P1_ANGAN